MKVFISWSGQKSKDVALLLKDWLPAVLQQVTAPWVSATDIISGANWSANIGDELASTDYSIICVTRENQNRPWLNFEAGAVSKLVGRAVPLLIDIESPGDLSGPMTLLQVRMANREGLAMLVRDMNELTHSPLSEKSLETTLERNWPYFEQDLNKLLTDKNYVQVKQEREDEDKLDELLVMVRELLAPSKRSAVVAPVTIREERDKWDRIELLRKMKMDLLLLEVPVDKLYWTNKRTIAVTLTKETDVRDLYVAEKMFTDRYTDKEIFWDHKREVPAAMTRDNLLQMNQE